MKKVLYLVVAALMTVCVVSCDKKQSSSEEDSAKDLEISKLLGTNFGQTVATPADTTFKLDKDKFLEGMKKIVLADTANMAEKSYLIGMENGIQISQETLDFEQLGKIYFDRKIFLDEISKAIRTKNPKDADYEAIRKKVMDYVNSKMPQQAPAPVQQQPVQAQKDTVAPVK